LETDEILKQRRRKKLAKVLAISQTELIHVMQWRHSRRRELGATAHLNFGLSENCAQILFLSENFRSKMQNLGPNLPIFGKFSKKIFPAPIISSVGNLQLYVDKIATSCPAYLF